MGSGFGLRRMAACGEDAERPDRRWGTALENLWVLQDSSRRGLAGHGNWSAVDRDQRPGVGGTQKGGKVLGNKYMEETCAFVWNICVYVHKGVAGNL